MSSSDRQSSKKRRSDNPEDAAVRRPNLVVANIFGKGKNNAKFAFPASVIHSNLASILGLTLNPWSEEGGLQQEWKVNGNPITSSKVELSTTILREMEVDSDMCRRYVELCIHGGHEQYAYKFLVVTSAPDELLDLYYARKITLYAEYFFDKTMENLAGNGFELVVDGTISLEQKEGRSPTFAKYPQNYAKLHNIHDQATLKALRHRIHCCVARLRNVLSTVGHLPTARRNEIIRKGLLQVSIPLYNIPAAV